MENVLPLTVLADRYDVKFLLGECEKLLLHADDVPLIKKFIIADKCNLDELQVSASPQ